MVGSPGGGVPGAAVGYYTTPMFQPDLNKGNMRSARLANALSGYLAGRGTVRGLGFGPKSHPLMGIEAGILSGVGSNLLINKWNAQEEAARAMPGAVSAIGDKVQAGQEGTGRKLLLAAGILAAGGLGATGYQALRDRKQDMARKGTIRVNLPTKRPGDVESTVDMPLDVLSNEAYKGIMRDTRRRVRAENAERVQRKGLALPAMQAGADMYDSFATPA